MAASLSRPDPSSPASVAEAGFSTARRGFQQDEVRAFLVSVAAELARLQERERQLDAELRAARTAAADGPPQLDEAAATELLGEETVRVLQTARESASQIKIRAEETAARILREANDEANRIRQETEVDAARRRQDAASDAEAEVALAKQQGREMVNEARAYRERVLADLERRTTLARKQIEELIHGRDRLLAVFERARLVAVDVTSELRDIDTPDELVNLAPTTGPVPIMVPNQRRVPEQPTEPDEPGPADAVGDEPGAVDEPSELDDSGDRPSDSGGTAGVAPPDEPAEADAGSPDEPPAGDGHDREADIELDAETDTDETDETDETEAEDEPDSAGTPSARDANVVSLFRDRPTPADRDTGSNDAGSDAAGAADDVGGIFARLRDELPAEPESTTDTAELDEAPTEQVADSAFARRDEVLVPLIVGAARKLKRVLADEQNLVLDTLRQKEPVTVLDDLVPELDEHASTYRAAIHDELIAAAAAGAIEVGAGDSRALRNRLGQAGALDDAVSLLRTAMIGPLRDRLQRSIADGGGDNEAITKRVRAVYREWKTQQIDGHLDDVFRFAHGGGIAVAVEPGSPMVWTIDPSEPACPDCEDNSLAGAVASGEPFPTGHTAAPAHPGCRCLVLPAG